MAIGQDFAPLMARIGYSFSDLSLLDCAMTHTSYANEQRAKGIRRVSNQRLEFLGDSILGSVISEYLYTEFPEYSEGDLTVLRRDLVCTDTLYSIASALSLDLYLHIGSAEEANGCRHRPKVLADALEALFGAVFLDSERSLACRGVILALFSDLLRSHPHPTDDPKTLLQQLVEKDGASVLEYVTVSESGPDHDKTFTVAAKINNNEVGRATAPTKKEAQKAAAEQALSLFGFDRRKR